MKKFVVLMLVLGIASMASATPVITVDRSTISPGEIATVTISGTVEDQGYTQGPGGGGNYSIWADYTVAGNYYAGDNGIVSFSNIVQLPGAGGAAASETPIGYDIATFDGFDILAASNIDASTGLYYDLVQAADWFTVDVTGLELGTITIELDNLAASVRYGSVDITVIPEPATMTLLGLGGLLLRKRRK